MKIPRFPLAEIATKIDYGLTASANGAQVGPKFLRITDIQDDDVDWDDVPFCEATPKKLAKARIGPGDIVFARTGATTGKSFLINDPPEDAVFASYLIRVRSSERAIPSYLAHFFRSQDYWSQIKNRTRGAAQGGVNATSLGELEIPLPPLEEQRRIAGILDAADALRRRRREALALLDTLPGAIFAEMFLSLSPGEPDRPTQPLGDLVDAVSGSTPSKGNKAFWDGDIPWISPKDMKSDDLYRAILTITEEATRSGKAKLVGPDVTLIVIRGMILAHSVPICDLRIPASFNQDVKALIPRKGVSNIFVSAALRASKNRLLSMVSNAAHGTKRIEMGDLMQFPVPAATEDEQEKFASAIAGIAAQRARFEDASRDGETLFASLQSRAFAGEL